MIQPHPDAERFRAMVERDLPGEGMRWELFERTDRPDWKTYRGAAQGIEDWLGILLARKDGAWPTRPAVSFELAKCCHEMHRAYFDAIGANVPDDVIAAYVQRSVQDYLWTTTFSGPTPLIVDFGAGYGRNVFLMSNRLIGRYVAVDAIERSYLLQRDVMRWAFGNRLGEYMDGEEWSERKKAHHVPTWKAWDFIPWREVNVLMLSWVFHELPESVARRLCEQFHAMPPHSIVYFRGRKHKIAHNVNLDRELASAGLIRWVDLGREAYDPGLKSGEVLVYRKTHITPPWRQAVRKVARGAKARWQRA